MHFSRGHSQMTKADGMPTVQAGHSHATTNTIPVLIVYTMMIVLTAVAYMSIRWIGETTLTTGVAAVETVTEAKAADDTIFHVLLALMLILVAGRVFGTLLAIVGQPKVIGEVVAGIALGPPCLVGSPPTR